MLQSLQYLTYAKAEISWNVYTTHYDQYYINKNMYSFLQLKTMQKCCSQPILAGAGKFKHVKVKLLDQLRENITRQF